MLIDTGFSGDYHSRACGREITEKARYFWHSLALAWHWPAASQDRRWSGPSRSVEAAAIVGNSPAMLRKHYVRVLPKNWGRRTSRSARQWSGRLGRIFTSRVGRLCIPAGAVRTPTGPKKSCPDRPDLRCPRWGGRFATGRRGHGSCQMQNRSL